MWHSLRNKPHQPTNAGPGPHAVRALALVLTAPLAWAQPPAQTGVTPDEVDPWSTAALVAASVGGTLDLRLQYSPSEGNRFDPFGDYSGQRYLMVLKASGVSALRQHPLLKYLELNVGYGTRNFDAGPSALGPPTRQTYVGLALNLSEVLRHTAYRSNTRPTRTQLATETFFEFTQVPSATVQAERTLR